MHGRGIAAYRIAAYRALNMLTRAYELPSNIIFYNPSCDNTNRELSEYIEEVSSELKLHSFALAVYELQCIMMKVYLMLISIIVLSMCVNWCTEANEDICEQIGIRFKSREKTDVEVNEGNNLLIPCNFVFNGTREPFPFWQFQRRDPGDTTFFFPGNFPFNMQYNQSVRGLFIENIGKDVNGTSIACCFQTFYLEGVCENNATSITVISPSTITFYASSSKPIHVPIAKSQNFTIHVQVYCVMFCSFAIFLTGF